MLGEDLAEHINRVAYGDERIVFTRHGKGVVALGIRGGRPVASAA